MLASMLFLLGMIAQVYTQGMMITVCACPYLPFTTFICVIVLNLPLIESKGIRAIDHAPR